MAELDPGGLILQRVRREPQTSDMPPCMTTVMLILIVSSLSFTFAGGDGESEDRGHAPWSSVPIAARFEHTLDSGCPTLSR
jgi:hypothetical protein